MTCPYAEEAAEKLPAVAPSPHRSCVNKPREIRPPQNRPGQHNMATASQADEVAGSEVVAAADTATFTQADTADVAPDAAAAGHVEKVKGQGKARPVSRSKKAAPTGSTVLKRK